MSGLPVSGWQGGSPCHLREPEAGKSPHLLLPSWLWPLSFRELGEFPVQPKVGFEGSPVPYSAAPPPAGPQGTNNKDPMHFPKTLHPAACKSE